MNRYYKCPSVIAILFSIVSLVSPLAAFEWSFFTDYELDTNFAFDYEVCGAFTGGYRVDQIRTEVRGFDVSLNDRLRDKLKISNMGIWEVGGKCRLTLCQQWFIQGHAFVGWAHKGRFEETTNIIPFECLLTSTTSHIHNGETQDYSVGLGYMFNLSFCDVCFRMGPSAGWSWDTHFVRIGEAETNFFPDFILSELKYEDYWQGPWMGIGAQYTWCGIELGLCYEYHFPTWRSKWSLRGPDVAPGAFSDKRHSHHGYGNIVTLDAHYCICDCLVVGVDFKYQDWSIKEGREKGEEPIVDCTALGGICPAPRHDKMAESTWKSYGLQVDLGFSF